MSTKPSPADQPEQPQETPEHFELRPLESRRILALVRSVQPAKFVFIDDEAP